MKTVTKLAFAGIATLSLSTGAVFGGDSQPSKRHHTTVTSAKPPVGVTIALSRHGQYIQESNGDYERLRHVTGPQGEIISFFAPVR